MNMEINDKLDALISLTAKDCGNDDVVMFNNLDTSKIKLDNKFYIKLRQVISKHKHSTTIILIKKCFVRIAVALMALMSLGFLTIMATPDLREALFEAVIEWYDNYISIRFEPNIGEDYDSFDTLSTAAETTKTLDGLQIAILPPENIEKVMKPTSIPQGAEEDIVMSNNSGVVIDYYMNDDVVLSYTQTPYRNKDLLFDNKTDKVYDVKINEHSAFAIDYETEGYAIIWTDGVYYYQICSLILDFDELIKIASSIN